MLPRRDGRMFKPQLLPACTKRAVLGGVLRCRRRFLSPMSSGVTLATERNEIQLGIFARLATKFLMVNLQVRHLAARLTPPPEPDRFTVEQTEDECAWICELPSGAVAFVGPAELTVPVPGTLIKHAEVAIPDFDCELDLSDPGESRWYAQLMNLLPYNLTKCLNHSLTSGVPLSVRQVRGAIIAEGWASVPAKLHDYSLVSVELFLWDVRDNDFQFNFRARVNRSLMRVYEQRQRERRERMRSTERSGIFGPARGQVGTQKGVSPKEAINLREARGDDDRELHKPN